MKKTLTFQPHFFSHVCHQRVKRHHASLKSNIVSMTEVLRELYIS